MQKLTTEVAKVGLPVFFFADPKDNIPNVKTKIRSISRDGKLWVSGIDEAMPINHFKISTINADTN